MALLAAMIANNIALNIFDLNNLLHTVNCLQSSPAYNDYTVTWSPCTWNATLQCDLVTIKHTLALQMLQEAWSLHIYFFLHRGSNLFLGSWKNKWNYIYSLKNSESLQTLPVIDDS